MTYSQEIRERAVLLVSSGRSRQEICEIFGISAKTLYNWTRSKDLRPRTDITRCRKLDKAALVAHVRDYPDALLRERAAHFGVHINAIWVALRQLDIRKKNNTLS